MRKHGIILAYVLIVLFIANMVYLHSIWHAQDPRPVSSQEIQDLINNPD